jgi:hypothetical protein
MAPLQALLALAHVADAGQADEDLAQLLFVAGADAGQRGAVPWAKGRMAMSLCMRESTSVGGGQPGLAEGRGIEEEAEHSTAGLRIQWQFSVFSAQMTN